jgi:hypothetical protein
MSSENAVIEISHSSFANQNFREASLPTIKYKHLINELEFFTAMDKSSSDEFLKVTADRFLKLADDDIRLFFKSALESYCLSSEQLDTQHIHDKILIQQVFGIYCLAGRESSLKLVEGMSGKWEQLSNFRVRNANTEFVCTCLCGLSGTWEAVNHLLARYASLFRGFQIKKHITLKSQFHYRDDDDDDDDDDCDMDTASSYEELINPSLTSLLLDFFAPGGDMAQSKIGIVNEDITNAAMEVEEKDQENTQTTMSGNRSDESDSDNALDDAGVDTSRPITGLQSSSSSSSAQLRSPLWPRPVPRAALGSSMSQIEESASVESSLPSAELRSNHEMPLDDLTSGVSKLIIETETLSSTPKPNKECMFYNCTEPTYGKTCTGCSNINGWALKAYYCRSHQAHHHAKLNEESHDYSLSRSYLYNLITRSVGYQNYFGVKTNKEIKEHTHVLVILGVSPKTFWGQDLSERDREDLYNELNGTV